MLKCSTRREEHFSSALSWPFVTFVEETTDIDARSIFIQTVYASVFMPNSPPKTSLFLLLSMRLPYFCILNYSFFLFILSFNIHREQNDTFFVIDFAFALSAFSLSLLCSLSFTLGLCFFLSPPYLPFILGADPGVLSLLIRFSSALDFCFVLRFGWGCCYFISVLVCSLCLIWTIFQKGHKKCFHVLQ